MYNEEVNGAKEMDAAKLFLKSTSEKGFWKLIFVFLGALLFFGGLGEDLVFVRDLGVIVSIAFLGLVWTWRKRLRLPPGILLYIIFLSLLLLSTFGWSVDIKQSYEYLSLFFSGGLFWVAFYNLQKEAGRYFDKLIIVLGLIFGGLFLYEVYKVGGPIFKPSFKLSQVKPWSLYLQYSAYLKHSNIGDLWSAVLTIIVFYLSKKPKNIFYWLLTFLGIYLLIAALSRAAYVAFAVGVIYLTQAKAWLEKYQKILTALLLTAAMLFLFAASQKTTLFSRQYYVQGILGLMHNPWGVGIGNFGIISKDPANHLFGLTHFSSNAHNIVLEVLAGMGILGVSFIIWLIKILIDLWNEKDSKNLVYRAVFFVLFANFFFHSSYFIPTMLWLWFMSLGLAQDRIRSR